MSQVNYGIVQTELKNLFVNVGYDLNEFRKGAAIIAANHGLVFSQSLAGGIQFGAKYVTAGVQYDSNGGLQVGASFEMPLLDYEFDFKNADYSFN